MNQSCQPLIHFESMLSSHLEFQIQFFSEEAPTVVDTLLVWLAD